MAKKRKSSKKKTVKARANRTKGMRGTQKVVLMALLDGALDGVQLGEKLGIRRSVATQRCAPLSKAKLISRTGDGYVLTAKGLKIARELSKYISSTVRPMGTPRNSDEQISSDLLEVVTRDGLSQADRAVVLKAARRLGGLPQASLDSKSGILVKV